MSKELTQAQKKEWAQLLYLADQYTQKDIAAKVKVTEKTMSNWVRDGKWELLRKSLLTTKNEILRNLYNLLDKINKKLNEEDTIGDTKIADMYVKYTAAIKNLETETSVGQHMESGRMFVNWLLQVDPQLAQTVLNNYDSFIKEQLKRF